MTRRGMEDGVDHIWINGFVILEPGERELLSLLDELGVRFSNLKGKAGLEFDYASCQASRHTSEGKSIG